jgi:hypothetical protein
MALIKLPDVCTFIDTDALDKKFPDSQVTHRTDDGDGKLKDLLNPLKCGEQGTYH